MFVLVLLTAAAVAVLFCANMLYNLALNPRFDKSRIFGDKPEEETAHPKSIFEGEAVPEDWWITSFDGLRLHGLAARQKAHTDLWVIGVHGYTGCAEEMGFRAGEFYRRGYNVLFPDNRGHGKSQGGYAGMGWHDRLDLCGWIDALVERQPRCRIVLYGVSMGGAAVMMTSGESLPGNVRVVVEDCGYSSVKAEMAHEAKYLFRLPYFPLVSASSLICRLRAGFSFGEASSVKQLQKCRRPILFIHGSKDTFVPYAMLEEVYAAAPSPKEKLTVEGAGHAESYVVDPQTYWHTVFTFADRFLGEDAGEARKGK